MKANAIIFRKSISILILLSLFWTVSCSNDSSDNIKNERQTNISKLKLLQDSIKIENEKLAFGKENVDEKLLEISEREIEINKKVQLAKLNEVNNLIASLKYKEEEIEDSLNLYTNKLIEVNSNIETLSEKRIFIADTKEKSKENASTNINKLEATINTLKINKDDKGRELILIDKRKELLTKKNELLNTELEYKKIELNELYSQTSAEEKIKEVNKNITQLDKEISENKNSFLKEELSQKIIEKKISELNKEIETKQNHFKLEYEKSLGLSDFVKNEKETIDNKIKNLESKRAILSNKWKNLKTEKEKNLNNLNEAIDKKANILPKVEKRIVDSLAEEDQLNEFDEILDTTDMENSDDSELNDNFMEEETITSQEKEENNSVHKLLKESREVTEGPNSIFYILFLVAIFVVGGLYWLGKKNKQSSN